MGSAAKARAARAADAASAEARRHAHSLMPTHVVPAPPTGWVVLTKSIRGVVTAFVASAKPLGLAGVVVGLVWLALKIVDRFQLWMTAAGVLMVVMSVASAFQEVAKPSTATVEYLDEDVEGCTKMITIPTVVPAQQQQIAVTVTKATTPVPTTKTPAPKKMMMMKQETQQPETVTIVHCGTVIDIQGSRGFIIPHSLDVNKPVTRSYNRITTAINSNRQPLSSLPEMKLPFVIAFELTAVLAVLRHEIMVGSTVQFNFPGDSHSPETVLALNVKPVASENEIAKSRDALQTCKLAREQSFARAMGELKMISPRNVPIKHHVDLIKYAEHLDDDVDLPLDEEFI